MVSIELIREHVDQLLAHNCSLDEFEDWLVGASWNMHKNADSEVQQLVGFLELHLAEYSAGHLDYSDLIVELRTLQLHGATQAPFQAVFISFADSSASSCVVPLTTERYVPDYQLRVDRPRTSPVTTTGSAKTVVQERTAIPSRI